jgi:hypothetical protein
MFDALPSENHDAVLTAVRAFFTDHGHELADAARLLGGAAAEARVVSCGLRLETATRIDAQIRRDLASLHRLLALTDVGDPERIERALFSTIDPASRLVDTICLLTEMLEDLLRTIDSHASGNRSTTGPDKGSLAA